MKRKISGEVTATDALQLPLPPPVGGGEAAGGKAAHGGNDEATVAEEQRLKEGGEKGGEDREEEEEEEEGEEKGEKGYDKFDHLEIDDDGEADDTERPKLAEDCYEIEAVRKKRVRKGEAQYLIKWRGWPETANTWEPIENLLFCSDVIDAFEERRSSGCAFPVVIVAHPSQPNQIVLGMSDGAVYVIEPFDAEQNWGRIVPL